MSMISPIEAPAGLADRATRALRAEILACRLAPGEVVSETLMIERLGLGRAPVRAALARLAEEALVQAVPRRGWVVSLVTVRDIHEVFALRLLLEPEAARLAATGRAATGRAGTENAMLQRLDQLCSKPYQPSDPDSALAFLEANRAFHVAVADMAGNQRLARQIGRLLDEATRLLVLGLAARDRSDEIAHEHRALIEALASGDGAAAADIMRQQVADSRDMVLHALTGPRSTLAVSDVR